MDLWRGKTRWKFWFITSSTYGSCVGRNNNYQYRLPFCILWLGVQWKFMKMKEVSYSAKTNSANLGEIGWIYPSFVSFVNFVVKIKHALPQFLWLTWLEMLSLTHYGQCTNHPVWNLWLKTQKNEQATIKHLVCKHLLETANQVWPVSVFFHHLTDCQTHQTGVV